MTLQDRIDRLTPEQRALLSRSLRPNDGDRSAEHGTSSPPGRLVAYFVVSSGQDRPAPADLRRFLSERLPVFMVPSAFVPLEALPLLPNGKVDRKSLAGRKAVAATRTGALDPPTRPEERHLLQIWREALGNPALGPDDDFFEAGGDSIVAIQLISKAAKAGIRITLTEFFRAPTVAHMADLARSRAREARPGFVPLTVKSGPVPLTPIQQWFFEQDFSRIDQWNQAQSVDIPAGTNPARLEAALQAVVGHHDALRLTCVRKGGGWQQLVRESSERPSLLEIDLSGATEEEKHRTVDREASRLHASMRLDSGVLLRAARFRSWSADRDLLILAAHHLAVDVISWGILLDDLETAYQQLEQGSHAVLPEATSFSQWSHTLHAVAQGDELRREAPFWTAPQLSRISRLPHDFSDDAANNEASAEVIVEHLGAHETARLLDTVAPTLRAELPEVLLTAIVRSLASWAETNTLLVGLEGHGRQEVHPGLDVSRTVGWLTSYCPVGFELHDSRAFDDVLQHVTKRLRGVPNKGIGYGLLRYLTADADLTMKLGNHPAPEVIFNYLGHERTHSSSDASFRRIPDAFGHTRSGSARRASVFEINSWVAEGRLTVAWSYSRHLHRRDTVQRLTDEVIDCLATLARRDYATGRVGLTPSDFPDADLNQDDLDRLADRLE